MARTIEIVIPHQLGVEVAQKRLHDATAALQSEFGKYASSVEQNWSGPHLDFVVKAMGAAASGTADVSADRVTAALTLPLLLRPFAGQIESYLNQHGPRFFAAKPAGR